MVCSCLCPEILQSRLLGCSAAPASRRSPGSWSAPGRRRRWGGGWSQTGGAGSSWRELWSWREVALLLSCKGILDGAGDAWGEAGGGLLLQRRHLGFRHWALVAEAGWAALALEASAAELLAAVWGGRLVPVLCSGRLRSRCDGGSSSPWLGSLGSLTLWLSGSLGSLALIWVPGCDFTSGPIGGPLDVRHYVCRLLVCTILVWWYFEGQWVFSNHLNWSKSFVLANDLLFIVRCKCWWLFHWPTT